MSSPNPTPARIAILILAHGKVGQLNRLVSHLSKDFATFVHLDKKCRVRVNQVTSAPNVHVIKRYEVYWGSFNMIRSTLDLMDLALDNGTYDRFLLLSGQDIPLVSNKKIVEFFTGNNTEYITCTPLPTPYWLPDGGLNRVMEFHPRSSRGIEGYRCNVLRAERIILRFLNRVVEREPLKYALYGGDSWFHLTRSCVHDILQFLSTNRRFIKRFKYTMVPEEIFFQTALMSSNGANRHIEPPLIYLDWKTGPEGPRILRMADYERVMNSGMLFARKVDEAVDKEVIQLIYDGLL